MTQMLGTILVLLAFPLVLASHGAAPDTGRIYHRVLVKDIPVTDHTHVCTTGLAVLVKKEADGDVHIRVENGNGSKAFIIAEIIPTLKPVNPKAIRIPKQSEWIEVCGIVRQDRKHKTPEYPGGWFELHPVERLK